MRINFNYYIIFLLFYFYQTCLQLFFPLIGDDIFNSLFKGEIKILDSSIFEMSYVAFRDWLLINSRFQHLSSPLNIIFFYFVNETTYIKVFHYIINCLAVLSFSIFIYLFSSKNKTIFILSLILFPALFQFRDWHDPFLIFPISYNVLVIFIFSSLYFFYVFLSNGKSKLYYFSLILYFFSCGTYEPSLLFSPIFLYVEHLKKKQIKLSINFLVISLVFILIIIYLKFFHSLFFDQFQSIKFSKNSYWGTKINFDFTLSLKTYFIQFFGSFPLSFLTSYKKIYFNFYDVIIFFIFGYFLYFFLLQNQNELKKLNKTFFLVLFIFISFSVSPISISSKYLEQIPNKGIGYAHIPVFFQYFGSISLFLWIISKFLQTKIKYRIFIVTILITFTSFLNYSTNKHVLYSSNFEKKIFKQNIIDSIKSGLFDNLDDYSNIFFMNSNYDLWIRSQLFLTYTNKKFFTHYSYGKNLFDLKVSENNNLIYNENPILFDIKSLKINKLNNQNFYFFNKNYAQYENLEKFQDSFLQLNNNIKNKIYDSSDKIYILYNLPNYKDNRVILLKISKIKIIENKITDLFINEFLIYSKKNGNFNIRFNIDLSVKRLFELVDLQDPNLEISKKKLQNFENLIIKPNTNPQSQSNFIQKNNFYTGKMICEKKNITISSFPTNQIPLIDKSYDRISVFLHNNSNYSWKVNNLFEENPITIRSYLKNSLNNNTKASISFLDYKIIVKPGEYKKFYVEFNDIIKLRSNALINKNYDKLIIGLVHEGKKWFEQDDFEPCEINLKY